MRLLSVFPTKVPEEENLIYIYHSLRIKPNFDCHDWSRDDLISSGVKKKLRGYKYHTENYYIILKKST